MEKSEAVWRFMVTTLAVWRFSRLLSRKPGVGSDTGIIDIAKASSVSIRVLVARSVDFLCLVSVWMSSQTAIWVASGFAGVFLSWLTVAGVSRLLVREAVLAEPKAEIARVACGNGLQAHHG